MPETVDVHGASRTSSTPHERALEALRLADSDPRRAAVLATDAAQAAGSTGDLAAAAIAARARGLAAYHLEDLDAAVRHLRQAIALGTRARSPQLAAEARMTLAFALNWRGQPRAALREINRAVQDLSGVARARATAQRGAILHQLGRLDEALTDYRAALPVLRRENDQVWVQRVLSNRGNLRARRHEFAAAEQDLHEAERLCRELDLDLSAGNVQHNLGYLDTLRGDIPAALANFDRAEERFRGLGSQLGPLLVDRSEVLLSARLIAEARATSEAAVATFRNERRGIVLPEARLLLARVAQLEGDLAAALHEAGAAAREFARLGQTAWAAVARVRVLSIRLAAEPALSVGPARIARECELTRGRWPGAELELQLAAARRAMESGHTKQAGVLLEAVSRRRRSASVSLRAGGWYGEALLRRMSGNGRGALSAARSGLRVLDAHAATLGATDLRAHASGHRVQLVALGLRMARDTGSIDRVFEWAELGRARHLQYPPVRPPDDPDLASALAELRMTARDLNERRGAGRATQALRQRRVALERRIRDHHRRHRGDETSDLAPLSLPEVGAALGEAALLEFVEFDGTMHAVSVVDGRARLVELGPVAEIRTLVERVPFALHRLVRRNARPGSRSAGLDLLRDTARRLDALLIAALPEVGDRPLVIVPTGPLQPLPWSILPSCAGRPLTVAPSAGLWHSAHARVARRGHVVVAAGPGLPGARAEAQAVAAAYGSTALLDDHATVQAVSSGLNRAAMAHLAAHGTVRADNPLFSALRLADGPLMVYDLEKVERAPHTVVVAACDTGRPVVPVGDELMGLSATFLAQGTAQLIASVVPIHDVDTAPLMVAFHQRLAAGMPAAAALAAAQSETDDDGLAVAAGFVCFGAGHASPIPVPARARAPQRRANDSRNASSRAT